MVYEFPKIPTFTNYAKRIVELLIKKITSSICVYSRGQSYGEKETHYRQLHWYLCYDRIVYGQTFYKVPEKKGCKNELSYSIFFLMPLKGQGA